MLIGGSRFSPSLFSQRASALSSRLRPLFRNDPFYDFLGPENILFAVSRISALLKQLPLPEYASPMPFDDRLILYILEGSIDSY